jgi:hypothetical protein
VRRCASGDTRRQDAVDARRTDFDANLFDATVRTHSGQQELTDEEWAVELGGLAAGAIPVDQIPAKQADLHTKAVAFATKLLYTSDASFVLPGMKHAIATLATRSLCVCVCQCLVWLCVLCVVVCALCDVCAVRGVCAMCAVCGVMCAV